MPERESPEAAILGLDNVAIDLPVAGIGSRILAAFLDYIIVAFLGILLAVFAIATLATRLGGGWSFAVVLVGFFLLEYGYFAGSELLAAGRTAGKQVLGLRVSSAQGGRPGAAALLIRNVVRSVDLVTGLPLMAVDPRARRLGDRLAGTLVLHTRASESQEVLLRRLPRGWGPREAAVLEAFLRRAPGLEPSRRDALARKLVAAIDQADRDYLASSPTDWEPAARLRHAAESGEP
jgi:uncharacterized RDD family membrane protein YckC